MTVWVDLVARARGLSARLLTPVALNQLAHARDLRDLSNQLATQRRRAEPESVPSARELERVERRRAAAQLHLLLSWAGSRGPRLEPLTEQEDCRSLRALLRASMTHVPVADRLAGLLPTPALPQRVLAQLAACSSPADIAALLGVWGNPFGAALMEGATRHQPDLFALERTLVHTWSVRARRSQKSGGRAMRLFVSREVDLANCWSALMVVEHGFDGDRDALFLEGGSLVTRDAFARAANAPHRAAAGAVLAPLVRLSPLAGAATPEPGVEARIRRAMAREQHDLARREPLGLAPVIEYWLRLREEVVAVQRIIWSVAAGASVPLLEAKS